MVTPPPHWKIRQIAPPPPGKSDPFRRGGLDIFWNHTISQLTFCVWNTLLLLGIQTGDKLAKPRFLIAYSRLCRHCRNLAKRGCLLHMAISFYALSLLFGSCRLSGLKSVMQQPALVKVALPPLRKCFDVLDSNIEFQWNKIITEIQQLIQTSDIMVPNLTPFIVNMTGS